MVKTLNKTPKPPKALQGAGKDLWKGLQAAYQIVDAGGLALLNTAAECRDLEVDAMTEARKDGLTVTDRYGAKRGHPMLTVARDARAGMLASLRMLALDLEPLHERPGRPAGS